MILDLEAVQPGGPVPAELVHGFDDGEARETDAALGGAIASHLRLAFYEPVQVVYMGPLLGYGLGGQFRIVPSDKRQFQIAQVVVKVAWRSGQGWLIFAYRHGVLPPLSRGTLALGELDRCGDPVVRAAPRGDL